MKYFDHDVDAHKDDKIILLRKIHGGAAVDAYWTILEIIYRDETNLKTDIKPNDNQAETKLKPNGLTAISFFLQVDENTLKTWIETMCELGLFSKKEGSNGHITIASSRATANINTYKARCETNRENGSKGGRPKKTAGQSVGKTKSKPNGKRTESELKPTENPAESDLKPNRVDKEKEKEKYKEDISNDISKKKGADLSAITEIVDYLNQAANTSFKASSKNTQSLINARTREGFTVDDFKTVIDGRVKAWANDQKMSEYLRPQTLFGTKFESYLNASKAKPKTDEEEWNELFEEYARYERENTTVYCPPC